MPLAIAAGAAGDGAHTLLGAWPSRLRAITAVKPLDEAWMPAASPACGATTHANGHPRGAGLPPHWWRWALDRPTVLTDATTGADLPDRFPFRNMAAMCAYRATLGDREALHTLADAFEQSGDDACAAAVASLLAAFAPIYPTLPLTLQEDANPHTMPVYGPEIMGQRYAVRARPTWRDSADLFHWLLAYRSVRRSPAVTEAQDQAVRGLAEAVLGGNTLPNFLYFNDKYHNSLMDYHQVFVVAAAIWGQALEARDPVGGTRYRGGDLAQLAINGPAGLRAFAANAFDREGVYWELSCSYTGYVLGRLKEVLPVLDGYSDPDGYEPAPHIRPFYRPLHRFSPAADLPELWRAVLAQPRLALSGGQFLPTNDANYLNRVSPEDLDLWGACLRSEPLREAARQARAFAAGRSPHVLRPGSTLMAASGAVTLRGPANRLNVHLDWHRVQDYHSHFDPLNLLVSAEKATVIDDLGYHLGHPLRHILSERTAAHNTVSIDGGDAVCHGAGVLHHVILDTDVQLVDASVPDAYPQADRYRRAVILVSDRYVVDIFRVAGGARHDYALLSRATDSVATPPLVRGEGTVADPGRPYAGFDTLDARAASPANPSAVLHHPAFVPAEPPFQIDWPQRDHPGLTARVRLLAPAEARLTVSRAPYKDRLRHDAISDAEMVIARREGAPGLRSTFVSVIEALSAGCGALEAAETLAVASPGADAVAVEIRHEAGTDILIQATGPGPHQVAAHGITLHGTFAALRIDRGGGVRLTMLSGRIETPWGNAGLPTGTAARVNGVDLASGTVRLDRPLAAADRLAGRFVSIRGQSGVTAHWRVAAASADGTQLALDQTQSALVTLQGTLDRVVNTRVFSCGLRLPEPPRPGTSVRIGPVGDFSARRHTLAFAAQTGLPLRIGGTTTTEAGPRAYQIGLDVAAHLKAEDVGQPFWVSGIETGDDVFDDPWLAIDLDRRARPADKQQPQPFTPEESIP